MMELKRLGVYFVATMSIVQFTIQGGVLKGTNINLPDVERGNKIIRLTEDALKEEVFPRELNLTWKVYSRDYPLEMMNFPMDKYSLSCVQLAGNSHKAYPCWMFNDWFEVGVNDYEQLIRDMEYKGTHNKYEYEKMIWRGAWSVPKRHFCELGKTYPWIDAYETRDPTYGPAYLHCKHRIDLAEHTKWKYLMDIGGEKYGDGYSARLKSFMFSNRVVFVQDRPCGDMTFDLLKDGENCIFVKKDFSDLEEKYKWVESQGERFQQEMAGRLLEVGKNHCRREHAYARIRELVYGLIE